jgi:hypothetical protein
MPFDYTKYPGLKKVGIIKRVGNELYFINWKIGELCLHHHRISRDEVSRIITSGYKMSNLVEIEKEYRVWQLIDYVMRHYKLSAAEEDYITRRILQDFSIK